MLKEFLPTTSLLAGIAAGRESAINENNSQGGA